MSDPFASALDGLVGAHVAAAALTDLDGEDIAVSTRDRREDLRMCAAYGGIALRRLGQAEAGVGRAPIARVTLEGRSGRLLAMRLATDYQLVCLSPSATSVTRALAAAVEAGAIIEENL